MATTKAPAGVKAKAKAKAGAPATASAKAGARAKAGAKAGARAKAGAKAGARAKAGAKAVAPKKGRENKTVANDDAVAAFVARVEDPAQRDDARTLIKLLSRVSREKPRMWGTAIIGFGEYHYRYESGREGDMARIAFSPRKGKTVLYVTDGFPAYADLLRQLGKHATGKSCLYLRRLSDVDLGVLERLAKASLEEMARKYPR